MMDLGCTHKVPIIIKYLTNFIKRRINLESKLLGIESGLLAQHLQGLKKFNVF